MLPVLTVSSSQGSVVWLWEGGAAPRGQEMTQISISPTGQAAVDIRADPMLYEACKEDSETLCKDVKNGGGRIQACLVSSMRLRLRPVELVASCSTRSIFRLYVNTGCNGISTYPSLLPCLPFSYLQLPDAMQRDKRMQLSWACEEQLFRQEMENADDIRLSVRLFSKCMPDKRKVGLRPIDHGVPRSV